MKNYLLSLGIILGLGVIALPAISQVPEPMVSQGIAPDAGKVFVKKRYSIKGEAKVFEQDGQSRIEFSDDFRTRGGPDLKVYLSKLPIADLESQSVESQSVKLSVLKSNRGEQSYIVPQDVNLSEYKSVIIHCEAFSVLWGGFDL